MDMIFLIRALAVSLIFLIIIDNALDMKLLETTIILYSLLTGLVIFILGSGYKYYRSGFESFADLNSYSLDDRRGDFSNTGLDYDNNQPSYPLLQEGQFEQRMPNTEQVDYYINRYRYNNPDGFFLMNNNIFSEDNLPYNRAGDVIYASKAGVLKNQHLCKTWSPDVYLGKDRSYLNW
jgi:hypothetical protein